MTTTRENLRATIERIEAEAEAGGTGGPVVQPCPSCGALTVDPAYYDAADDLRCGAVLNAAETAWVCEECEECEEEMS